MSQSSKVQIPGGVGGMLKFRIDWHKINSMIHAWYIIPLDPVILEFKHDTMRLHISYEQFEAVDDDQ